MPKTTASRTYVLNKLIADNNLHRYLEVGVSNPYTNYLSIRCDRKTSVDPCIECEYFDANAINGFKTFIDHQVTSDEFFSINTQMFDIIFIDGDHSYEQSLRDLNNALKFVPVNGFVVLHDAMPLDYDSTQYSNFEKKLSYNGEVWKTVVSAIRQGGSDLKIGTFAFDFGVTVIKKLSDNVPEIKQMDLDYHRDYSIRTINPVYDYQVFKNQKVSYFTGLFNTPTHTLERVTKTLLNQTNPNWEWVLHDDSDNENDAKRLENFFQKINDARIKYYRFNKQSGASVGRSKKRAANLCTGDYLAELDHDDLLMPEITDQVLKNADGFDFIYSNSASVIINSDDSFSQGEYFQPGFAMGYGAYRTTVSVNPLTGIPHEYQECLCTPINPKTIRHIVSVPNHIRIWSKSFYDTIGGHNSDLGVADDYELIVRTFINGGRFLHLDCLGYLQSEDPSRTSWARNREIGELCQAILATYDERIKQEFELRNMSDWAYEYVHETMGFRGETDPYGVFNYALYYNVPTYLDAPAANCKIEI